MARWGSCDFRELQALQHRLDQLDRLEMQAFCQRMAKQLAARLLALVIPRTPVGEYGTKQVSFVTRDGRQVSFTAHSHKTGGHLRQSWTDSAGLTVVKQGDAYVVTIENSALYASYVEYGHRTANHKGWVPGQLMLTISEQQLQTRAPKIIEHALNRYLEGVINGK